MAAIPPQVNLTKRKPEAIQCYTRRVKSLVSNSTSAQPNSLIRIKIDTSTPGAFIDPLQSYLKFDITLTNSNPFIDYVSLGNAGFGSVIDQLRVMIQGVPVETIERYNLFFETLLKHSSYNWDPLYLYRPSTLGTDVPSPFDLNCIKAPMVDQCGNTMYGDMTSNSNVLSRNHYLKTNWERDSLVYDGSSHSHTYSFQVNWFNDGITNRTGLAEAFRYNPGFTTKYLLFGSSLCSSTTAEYTGVSPYFGSLYFTSPLPIYPSLSRCPAVELPTTLVSISDAEALKNKLGSFYQNCFTWGSFTPKAEIENSFLKNIETTAQYRALFMSNVKNIPVGIPGVDRSTEKYTINNKASYMWNPYFKNLPALDQTASKSVTYTVCLPILSGLMGMNAEKSLPTYLLAPGSTYLELNLASAEEALQVSMDPTRVVSGTIRDYVPFGGSLGGVFGQYQKEENLGVCTTNSKYGVPSPVIFPSGSYGYTPLRRIYQSEEYNADLNDYVPGNGGYTTYQTNHFGGLIPSDVADYPTSLSDQNPANYSDGHEGWSCIGISVLPAQRQMIAKNSNNINLPYAEYLKKLIFQPFSKEAVMGSCSVALTDELDFNGNETYRCPLVGPSAETLYKYPIKFHALANYITNQEPAEADSYNVVGSQVVAASGGNPAYSISSGVTVRFRPSGIPMPQYYLHSSPWNMKEFTVEETSITVPGVATPLSVVTSSGGWCSAGTTHRWANGFRVGEGSVIHREPCSEILACYGSYLKFSRAQSRRCFNHNSKAVTFSLTNIEFVSQQIVLPTDITDSVISLAAGGDLSIMSSSVKHVSSSISNSSTQNIAISATVASANTLFFLIVPNLFRGNKNKTQLHNSLCGVCPFGSIGSSQSFSTQPQPVDTSLSSQNQIGFNSDDYFTIKNIPCTGKPFSVQLVIGNEYMPVQPIQDVSELIAENLKAIHHLYDNDFNYHSHLKMINGKTSVSGVNQGTTADRNLAFDVTSDHGFVTTFYPTEFLDDQTAISNPYMNYVYECELTRLGGYNTMYSVVDPNLNIPNQWNIVAQTVKPPTNYNFADYTMKRGIFSLPYFTPPESTFALIFDMDSWYGSSDIARSGRFLGNSTMNLNMTECDLFTKSANQNFNDGYTLETFITHDIRFSFQAGGTVQAFY